MTPDPLLPDCLNMLRALQWAGAVESGCSTCGPKSICPTCDDIRVPSDGHEPTCTLWALIRRVEMAVT